MFTGIIAELGTVASATHGAGSSVFRIVAPASTDGLAIGDSVAVDGVCLTATEVTGDTFVATAVGETLARTTLGDVGEGTRVNLERPMPADGRFDGHIVQGHVDGIGVVRLVSEEGTARRIRISIPGGLATYVVEKGSIAVNGTSLTITGVSALDAADPWFEIVAIPHTLDVTSLGQIQVGSRVNLEVDVIAKYVRRMTETMR